MDEKEKPNFMEVSDTERANRIDMTTYRLERFSDTKNAWLFVKRRAKTQLPLEDKTPNFLEKLTLEEANEVDMNIYRFETFSETRAAWMFVKRRVI